MAGLKFEQRDGENVQRNREGEQKKLIDNKSAVKGSFSLENGDAKKKKFGPGTETFGGTG